MKIRSVKELEIQRNIYTNHKIGRHRKTEVEKQALRGKEAIRTKGKEHTRKKDGRGVRARQV